MIKFKTLNIVAKSVLFNQGQIWTKTTVTETHLMILHVEST